MSTFGEIGHLPDSKDLPHYDLLIFGAIIFLKRNQKQGKYIYYGNLHGWVLINEKVSDE